MHLYRLSRRATAAFRHGEKLAAAGMMALLMAGCGQLPRDPEHTLDRVKQTKHMRVGLVENAPWTIRTSGGARGAEVELARRFAATLGAVPDWYWGGEQEHMEAIRRFELDLVIGGIESPTPWSKTVGLTRPYFTERIIVGVPAGSTAPDSLDGAVVSVVGNEQVLASLRKKNAKPVRATGSQISGLAAGPEWELRRLGLSPTGFYLLTIKHVMVGPPGENAWLKRLQEFLDSESQQVPVLLQESGGAQ